MTKLKNLFKKTNYIAIGRAEEEKETSKMPSVPGRIVGKMP